MLEIVRTRSVNCADTRLLRLTGYDPHQKAPEHLSPSSPCGLNGWDGQLVPTRLEPMLGRWLCSFRLMYRRMFSPADALQSVQDQVGGEYVGEY